MPTLDLRAFGSIGFQDFFLEKQGYKGKNLLKLIADRCLDINLDFCAITSCAEHVEKKSVHDRFGYLLNLIKDLPKDYETQLIEREYGKEKEPMLLVVEKGKKKTILINSHAVLCRVGDKRVDHMIIGSNSIPSYATKPLEKNISKLKTLNWVINYCEKRNLVQIALHPFAHDVHSSVGNSITPYLKNISAIEGQCSEFFIEKSDSSEELLSAFGKEQDRLAQKFSRKNKKPWISVSAAHRIEDIGTAYIKTKEKIRYDTANNFLDDLRKVLKKKKFTNKIGYQKRENLVKWFTIYKEAIKKDI